MKFLLDTNAIIRHFTGVGRIGAKAKRIIKQAENYQHELVVSIISLMEIIYLAEKHKIPINLEETINAINSKSCYSIIDFNVEILKVSKTVQFYELHDRLILATSKYLKIPIISSDNKFIDLKEFEVIWD